ncbi:glyoxalase [Kaistia algarum]|uniref:VOC family protein n=1 Tax=Kaistia algarum TaxID=2083279 RepID=UPI000CE7C640|nr:VOC family protein [Kaistia algarum]MCX5512318.1 VOC family protein [Kaistia algarum]PPE80408.1 glyoxalase [Kaistia algarum]
MQLHRGRLIDHVQLVVVDIERSRQFYEAVLKVIGVPVVSAGPYFYADELFVSAGEPRTGRCHLAFQAKDRATVEAFYEAGLAAGGADNGGPGVRDYHADYYAAFLLDPDGNNIEAVYHGPATYSAPSVVIEFPD